DENSYLTQARIFADGRLWVQAPPHPEFFRARSFIMDDTRGRFFAKAFPGWAAILSLGVRLRVPWAVTPLLSAATLVLAGWAGAGAGPDGSPGGLARPGMGPGGPLGTAGCGRRAGGRRDRGAGRLQPANVRIDLAIGLRSLRPERYPARAGSGSPDGDRMVA